MILESIVSAAVSKALKEHKQGLDYGKSSNEQRAPRPCIDDYQDFLSLAEEKEGNDDAFAFSNRTRTIWGCLKSKSGQWKNSPTLSTEVRQPWELGRA